MKFLKKIYYEKYTKKSYSISNVDLIIDRMFSKINSGVYIDIGCNHPIKFNNTYLLHKRGWSGINIDLDKTSINEFNKLRPKDYNIQAVVSNNESTKEIFYYHERSSINTLSEDLADSREEKPKKIISEKTVTLNKIIEESPFRDKKINLISIDIENYEYEALRNFNFNKYDVDVIVSEITDISQPSLEIYNQSIDYIINSKIYKLLIENNYKLINWINSDLVFVKKNLKLK